jgi:hypothetical protein
LAAKKESSGHSYFNCWCLWLMDHCLYALLIRRCLLLTKYHSGDQVKKTEMGRTCGTYGGEERRIQGFSGETWGKKTTWKTHA